MVDMNNARVAVIMGSDSDWPVMKQAVEILEDAGVEVVAEIVSAHRTPEKMVNFAQGARAEGFGVVIAGAGGAAHLPGMVAALTTLPVIGVPIPLAGLEGMDSLLSIVQMPAGVPVATMSIGGAKNAGLMALRILSVSTPRVEEYLAAFVQAQADLVNNKHLPR
jgi:5-(carboxyamino)imidazole ribonucleotide mutase